MVKRHPCLACSIHKRGLPKNNPTCDACTQRTDWDEIESSVFLRPPVPVIVREETKMEGKTCKDCGKTLPIENFSPNHKSPDGYLNTCKTCMIERIQAGKGKRQENFGPGEVVERLEKSPPPSVNEVVVDFSGHHDLKDNISKNAKDCFRTVEQHILYIVSLYINEIVHRIE